MLLLGLFLVGCNTVTVKPSEPITLLMEDAGQIPEEHLLDVGIGIFEPGPEQVQEEEEEDMVFAEVRKAETQYMPVVLATTLQNTGGWGAVRVIPEQRSEMDVWVEGEILESDGEVLKLRIRVKDSAHREWFQKTYQAKVGKNSYNPQRGRAEEPFQGLYNHIANDMLAYRRALTPAELGKIRTITELNFARRFSPEAFSEYLEVDKRGRYQILRLPAENDPFLTRVRQIRARDDLFVDTLQDHYGFFAQQMETPYQHWRHENYKENMKIRHVKASARRRMLLGALGVVGGIAAIATLGSSPNPFLGTVGGIGGTVGVGAGLVGFKRGWDERKEVKLHQEALREIAASLDAEIKPHTLTLEDRTVTLTGTVEQQYQQWQEILRQIYLQETGAVTIDGAEASP
jgi:hypothetical protein